MRTALFFNLPGATGHLNPTLPLVKALTAQGDQVIYYCGEESKAKVEKAGAVYRSYTPYTDYLHKEVEGNDVLLGAAQIVARLSEQLMVPLARDLEHEHFDYVLYTSLCPWGKHMARRFKVPAIMVGSLPIVHPLLFMTDPTIFKSLMITLSKVPSVFKVVHTMQSLSRQLGNPVLPFAAQIFDIGTNEGDLNLIIVSPKFHPYARLFKNRFEFIGPSFTEDRDGSDFPLPPGDEPLVYVSLGTVVNDRPEFFRAAFAALESLPVRGVVSTGGGLEPEALGPAPKNVQVHKFVPQIKVLQKASAFVTHGGMNSVHESLNYGVPMVVVPQQLEQALNGRIVRRRGAGIDLNPNRITAESLRGAIGKVLNNSSYARGAAELGEDGRQAGGQVRVVQLINQLLAQHRFADLPANSTGIL